MPHICLSSTGKNELRGIYEVNGHNLVTYWLSRLKDMRTCRWLLLELGNSVNLTDSAILKPYFRY